ncbi:MAG TPA: hypothetical protein VFW30_02710 [Bryocella sp.]|nr:hypothetical protein [Bryocella sp.]
MFTTFLVISSKDDSDATVRVQSETLLRGLKNIPGISAKLIAPSHPVQLENGACVLFHFDDVPAITSLKEARSAGKKFLAVCFGCDIYQFSRYLPSNEVADLYLMPTPLHTKILASQFYKPVYCLPLGLDPIAAPQDGAAIPPFPIKQSQKLLWFGYAESFNKGMASLVPVLKMHVESQRIQDFSLIVNEDEFANEFNFHTIPYSNDAFRQDASAFDYCILSHFSLDLSLNSYIKTPNKLITALMAGLIPIASDTPSYSSILREFGLDRFLFDSPTQLDQILRSLDPVKDSQAIIDSGIVNALLARFSDEQLAQDLLLIISEFQDRHDTALANLPPQMVSPRPQQSQIYFSQHLKDLLPSFLRAIRGRISR